MCSCVEDSVFGFGYNSFIVGSEFDEVLLVYYVCIYIEIEGDLFWNLDCYIFVKLLCWSDVGLLFFGWFLWVD